MTEIMELDKDLVAQVARGSDAPTPQAAIEAVLRKHLLLRQQEAVRELRGNVQFWPDYDYKAMRENPHIAEWADGQ